MVDNPFDNKERTWYQSKIVPCYFLLLQWFYSPRICKVKSEEFGLSMNVKKTKSMIFSRTENKPRICLKLDGHIIEQVSNYIYLGQNITDDARCEAEIKRRIEIARNTFLAMKGLFTNGKVKFALRLRLVNCYVWSVLLYGAETWTISKAMEIE